MSTKYRWSVAPVLMTPKMINAAAGSSSKPTKPQTLRARNPPSSTLNFSTLGRAPGRLSLAGRRITSRDLEIVEATSELIDAEIPDTPDASNVSLLRGFNATIPSSEHGKSRRRKTRNVDAPHMGLKQLGLSARGMLADVSEGASEDLPQRQRNKPRRGRDSLAATVRLGREELELQVHEISLDQDNIRIRRVSTSSVCSFP